jgi:nucleolar pre-ribosomal-associated protein 1
VKTRVDIWAVVPSKMINALIEAGLTKWVNADEVLALIAALVFNPSVKNRAGGLEHNKHFQILINHNALTSVKVSAALLIWKLYMMDPASNSNNSTLMRLLSLYNGSNLPEDNILLEVIKQVEAGMGSGWSNQIFSWNIKSINDSTSAQPIDFQGRHPMFNSTRDGFEVTIEVAKIRNSIKTFRPDLCLELLNDQRLQSCLNKINEFVALYGDLSSLESSYNCEFLLMVLVNCPDFFRGNGTVNVKLLVDTFGLGFVLCCLGSRQLAISRASLDIIATVVHHISLTETENGADQKEESTSTVGLYKERSAIRILLSKILTLISHLEDDAQFLPCNAIILGMLAQVVSNPGHFLYPKVMDFLLSGPTLHSGEIPMYRLFSQPDSSEIAVKELQWGLEALTSGLTTHDEVSLYLRRGVFDWAMTMSMSPWANSIKPHIRALLLKAQEVQGGSIGLVTRNAGLAWAENELFSEKISNKKDQKHFAGKLGLRFMAASDKNKLCQWTGNDRLGIANRFSL